MSWLAEEHDPEWPFELLATDFRLDPAATALLVVDMQGSDGTIDAESGLGVRYPEIAAYWNGRMTDRGGAQRPPAAALVPHSFPRARQTRRVYAQRTHHPPRRRADHTAPGSSPARPGHAIPGHGCV